MVLLFIGVALGLLYVARTILSARSADRTPTFIDQVAVLGMVIVLALALAIDNQVVNEQGTIELAVAALGLVFALFGLMAVILGRNNNNNNNNPNNNNNGGSSDDARGYLAIGIGLIIVALAFALPLLNQVAPSPTEVAFAAPTAINDVSNAGNSNGSLSNQRLVSNNANINPAPTQTPVDLAQTIPSPEPPDLYFFTPTPTPEGLSCNGVVEVDLNVRKYPSIAEGNIVAVAPEDEEVMIIGRNQATSWWYISFDIYEGWVDADFVDAEDTCDTIPTRAWAE